MVEYARAGTTELKKYFSNLMQDLKEKNLNIKERVKTPQVLNSEAQSLYYSHWIYSAVHIAVMVPKLNTLAKLAEAFQLPELRIESVVQFLIEHGLVEKHGANLKSGGVQIHLQNDAANISKHHTNWRIEAIKSLEQPQDHDLHYSGVSSLSRKDAENIKALLVDVIENYVRTIEKSPEEVLYNFSMDFFSVLKKTG